MKQQILEVSTPGMPAARFELRGDRELSVGSSPDADVPLVDLPGVPPRLLVLQIAEQGIHVRASDDVAPGFIYSGEVSREALLPWGEELYWGPARFTFLEDAAKNRATTALFAVAALALIGTGALLAGADASRGSVVSEPEPPALFQPAGCPDSDATLAKQRAAQARESARATAARAAFDRRDGRRALELFDQARACLQVARDAPELAKMTAELSAWRQQMDEELSTLRLRLRVALDQRKPGDALAAVRALEALVPESPPSAYRAHLAELHRDLDRQVARKGQ